MKHIVFEYKDKLSKGKWNRQECTVSSLQECIEIYGLGIDCEYRIISVKNVADKSLDWNVQHYGTIVDDYETKVDGNYIRQKIYSYENKYYIETWYNGIKLLFHELFD